jgi:hypothetical protein
MEASLNVLKDTAFWSTVIAVAALILSQLPPVRELLKSRQLRIIVPENLFLYHYMGNLQLQAFLAVHNTGGRTVTVQRIECVVVGEDRHWRLPAQTYLQRQTQTVPGQAPTELIIGWLVLKPGEHWAETIHFFKVWSVQDEEEATAISARIRKDISDKIAERKPNDAMKLVEADDNLVTEAKDFFGKRFALTKGNYKLFIAAISEKNEAISVRGFDFTLFDHQIRALRNAVDDYKTGAGIFFLNTDPSKAGANIRLRPITDTQARTDYARLTALQEP